MHITCSQLPSQSQVATFSLVALLQRSNAGRENAFSYNRRQICFNYRRQSSFWYLYFVSFRFVSFRFMRSYFRFRFHFVFVFVVFMFVFFVFVYFCFLSYASSYASLQYFSMVRDVSFSSSFLVLRFIQYEPRFVCVCAQSAAAFSQLRLGWIVFRSSFRL